MLVVLFCVCVCFRVKVRGLGLGHPNQNNLLINVLRRVRFNRKVSILVTEVRYTSK